jgi:hypothetical protein
MFTADKHAALLLLYMVYLQHLAVVHDTLSRSSLHW